jgi:hypothetical protein
VLYHHSLNQHDYISVMLWACITFYQKIFLPKCLLLPQIFLKIKCMKYSYECLLPAVSILLFTAMAPQELHICPVFWVVLCIPDAIELIISYLNVTNVKLLF